MQRRWTFKKRALFNQYRSVHPIVSSGIIIIRKERGIIIPISIPGPQGHAA
ncbi:MAG: hypothetical protein JRG73_16575 [Deltaproteobacteria bacterium]|nr:hypothetical protein [Deltaproteobacteria bacterium]MBW2308543.1 hypothetical protein [Deltaproteobacteria bacterium]